MVFLFDLVPFLRAVPSPRHKPDISRAIEFGDGGMVLLKGRNLVGKGGGWFFFNYPAGKPRHRNKLVPGGEMERFDAIRLFKLFPPAVV